MVDISYKAIFQIKISIRSKGAFAIMRVLNRKNATFLILLSCLTYSTAYVGRLCYAANLIAIREDFGIEQAIAGTVSSFYFFSYAAGQLINAFIAKYCNPKYTVALAMIVSVGKS